MGILIFNKANIICLQIFMLVYMAGCFVSSKYKKDFSNDSICFINKNTGLDSRIPLDGFYYFPTKYLGCVFFPNGVYIESFSENSFKNHKSYYKDKTNKIGVYCIEGDTVKAKILYIEALSRYMKESWYVLDEDSVLNHIYFDEEGDADLKVYGLKSGNFIKTDSLPNPNRFWILKRKWFWCDKQAYKKWKRQQKF